MKCAICGRDMVVVGDTFLCQVCNFDEIYEFNAFVKYDMRRYKK